jgi:hypothetical protein
MSLRRRTVPPMELTAAQQRTLDGLLRPSRAPPGQQAVEAVRERLESALRTLAFDPSRPLRLSKGRLSVIAACEGWFEAERSGEGPPFAHGPATAAGTMAHRAIQVDVASERREDVRTVVERAARRLAEDDEFRSYWRGLDTLDRAEHLAAAAGQLALYRAMFPPFDRSWQPVSEQYLAASLADRSVVLSGRVDLMLGRGPHLLVDFKTGEARPGYAEDMRFYALVVALSFGVAPYRGATVFCESMEWQPEDVTEEVLEREAGRVIDAARSAAELRDGRLPELTPGPHCRWCPRARTCPSSAAR